MSTGRLPLVEPLLTHVEAAEYLGVSVHTAYEWRKPRSRMDAPPAYRVGGRLRYRRSELDAWLEAQRTSA